MLTRRNSARVARLSGLMLLVASLVAGLGLSWISPAAAASAAQYVNTDPQTQGDWVGAYGADGYVLPFFATTRTTSGRDDPPADDVAVLPDYVDNYSRSGGIGYWVTPGADDPRALQTPDGSGRKKLEVYSGTTFSYTFTLNDDEPHLFTIYTTDFGSTESISQRFEILDANGQVLEARDIDTINDGRYVTFQVQGSFTFKATKLAGSRTYAQGFFFDEPVPATAIDVVATSLPGRKVELRWADSASTPAAVLRRLRGETDYVQVAETEEGVTTYVDEDLEPGRQYEYALRNIVGVLHSQPTAPVSITIPSYQITTLEFHEGTYVADEPGQELAIEAVFTDSDGEPLAGSTVTFELEGEHVGSYIEPVIGQAVTDESGVATLLYDLPYAGRYQLVARVDPDDERMLNGADVVAQLEVRNPVWERPPLLMRATDAVAPGTLFQASGHAMIADDWSEVTAVVEPLGVSTGTPSPNAVELEIVQRDEDRGQFLQFTFPDDATPGAYRLWVSNAHGWSEPLVLNAPRPLFISEYEVFDGLSIDLSGRNLTAKEFGASGKTRVRMVNGSGKSRDVRTTELTPYSLRFVVEDVPPGEYRVEVSNDGGGNWSGLQSGQTLTVVRESEDPLGLGVAWASHFRWDREFDVTDYGAVPDDDGDDTDAIAAAIAAAKAAGGGVVRLPGGDFHASVVQMPSGIVLMGEGQEDTLLYHVGDNQNFIQAVGDGKTEGRTGVARLGLRAADPAMLPDAFIWFGHDWGDAVNDKDLRTASEIFAFETDLEYPVLDAPAADAGSGRGQGMVVVGDERFLYKNNRAVGWSAQYTRVYVSEYAYSSDNYAEYSFSQMPISADYTFIRDNEFVIRGEVDKEVHGIGMKSNSHVENNVVHTTGMDQKTTYHNDGESILAEMPGGYFATGDVLGASDDSITLAPLQPLPESISLRSGRLTVMIVDGTGLGQLRDVERVEGTTFKVPEAWDVVPDGTSKFTLIVPNDNMTVYRNVTTDGQRGIWLYGNVVDAVVADNRLVNTDGIYVASTMVASVNRYTPAYFVHVKGNQLIGTPGEGHASGIISVSQRNGSSGRYYASGLYGVEVRDNSLYGSHEPISTPRHQKYSGIVSSAATLSSDSNPVFTPEDRDNLNVIMTNNRLENMADGVTLMSGLYGHTAHGNEFTDVDRDVYERYGEGTSRVLRLDGDFQDGRPPFWPALSGLQTELTGPRTAELAWDPAEDLVGVTHYRIYLDDQLLAQVDADQTEYKADRLRARWTYLFKVTAVDAAGNESYSGLETTVPRFGFERASRR